MSPPDPPRDPRIRQARRRFERIAALPDPEIDLAEATLAIAAETRPDLDFAAALRELDALADAARPGLDAASDEAGRIAALNRALFDEAGFHGDRDDYYDPDNSDLGRVLERRSGIPITLSVVYLEVAQRLGLHAAGVSFPGHFLVKVVGARETVVDVFERRVVDEAECAERLRAAMGPDARFDRSWLRAAANKEILARILRNLKQIRAARGEAEWALDCCDRILLLAPDSPFDVRDRGLLYAQLGAFLSAADDLERFLELAPDHPLAPETRGVLERVRGRVRRLH